MTDPEDVLAEVVALELRLLDPAVRVSAQSVEALLHPDFQEIGAFGRMWDRAAIVADLATEPGEGTEVRDIQARVVSDGVVLVTYVAAGERESLRSSLWVTSENGWRVLFHQGTPRAKH